MNGWDRFATGGDSTVESGGGTMVRNGLIRKGQTKRKRGDIWAHLSISACVLLVPPMVMAAGVMVFGSPSPRGQEGAVPATAASAWVGEAERSAMRPEGTSFALASAETHPVISEKGPIAEPRPASEQPAAGAQRASSGAAGVKDPARYSGAAPVTLVHAGSASEPSAMPKVEAPPAAADTPIAVPEESPAATQINGARAKGRLGRHEPRPAYRTRYQRTKTLSDYFLRPTSRPRG